MTREEAIFYIKELQKTYASMDKKVAEAVDMAIEVLSAERTGEWIVGTTKDFLFPDQYTNVYQCDQCGATEWRDTNYCPYCGAKMGE